MEKPASPDANRMSSHWRARLTSALHAGRSAARRRRVPLLVAGAGVLLAGSVVSVRALGLSWADVDARRVAVLFLLLSPLSLVLAAVALQLSARALGRRIGLADAFAVSVAGRVAEVLPIPAGAMVRGAALVRAGAGMGESAWIVGLAAALTLAMAASLAGPPLIAAGQPVGWLALGGGLAGTAAAAIWIARRAGAALTLVR